MTPNSWAWGELDPLLKPSTLCDSEEYMRHLSKFLRTFKIATWFKVSRKCQNPKTIRLREPIRANINNNTTQSKLKENTRDYAKRGKMRLTKSRLVELWNLIGWADEYLFLFKLITWGRKWEEKATLWKLFKCSRTYNFKQHISEVCPCAITVSRPEPWHWYNVHNDPLVNVKILSTRTAINQVIKMCLLLAISIQKKAEK